MKKKYLVTFHVDATYPVTVEAENAEEAEMKAEEVFNHANFGETENVYGELLQVDEL